MKITQKHLDFISQIYDLPTQPEKWQNILDQFVPLVNAKGAGVMAFDPIYAETNINIVTSNYTNQDPDFIQTFSQLSKDEAAGYMQMTRNPKREFISDMDAMGIVSEKDQAALPAVKWLTENYGVRHRAVSSLNLDRVWADFLAIQFEASRGPLSEAEKQIGNMFLPHFSKSVEVGRTFGVLKTRFQAVFSVLNKLNIGVFVLSSSERVVVKNQEAERILDEGDGLRLSRDGQLFSTKAGLATAISDVVRTVTGQDIKGDAVLTIERRSGETPYLVEVCPIRDDEIESKFKGCLVFVIDPSQTQNISTIGMETIFSLTTAESEICHLLAHGQKVNDIADGRNTSPGTVRSQIRTIFDKTQTNSLLDLVRLALKVNLPIDQK